MRLLWAIAGGLAIGGGIAWWSMRPSPQQLGARQARAERAAADTARDARFVLYRWRDAQGALHVTGQPPSGPHAGRRYERIDPHERTGIEVRGDRD